MKRQRRILYWTAGVCAALLALLVTAAMLLPRLVNTELVRSKIESTISRDLGGTLTYDRVALSILPRPRIVLRKLKIEVPGTFSAALSSLDIYPALLPLIHGDLQITEVHLERPGVTVLLPGAPGPVRKQKRPASGPKSSPEQVLAVAAKKMPGIIIVIDKGRLTVMRGDQMTLTMRDLNGRVAFLPEEKGIGSSGPPLQESFRLGGDAKCTIEAPGIPMGSVILSVERIEALPGTFTFSGARARLADLSVSLSGRIDNYLTTSRTVNLDLTGTAGPNTVQWLRDSASLSPLLTPRAPLNLSDTHIRWVPGTLQAAGRATVKGGPALDFDIRISPGDILLKRLAVHDKESRANLSLKMSERVVDLSFSGNLTRKTLDDLFGNELFPFGWMKGDLKVRLPLDHLAAASAEGVFETEQMVVPWKSKVPFTIDRLMLSARDGDVKLDPAAITLGSSKGVFSGTITASDIGVVLDLDLTSRVIEWDDLRELFLPKEKSEGTEKEPGEERDTPKKRAIPIRGTLRVDVDALRGKRFTFQPVRGTILLDQDGMRYDIRETAVCGIGIAGTGVVSRGASNLSLNVSAKEQELAPTLLCLAGSDLKITGKFDLTGRIAGAGPNKDLMRSLGGKIAFAAKNGSVNNDVVVTPILRYKRINDLLGDKAADAKQNGIPYDTFGIRGTVNSGTLTVTEGVIKSPLMNLAANGDVDLVNDRLDITFLIAPFKTVDAVVKKIPLLGNILGGTLVTVPVRVHGPFKEPKVTPLPPSAVGEGLIGIMKRTLELPFNVIDDVSPRKRSAATPSAQ